MHKVHFMSVTRSGCGGGGGGGGGGTIRIIDLVVMLNELTYFLSSI